MVTSDGSEFDTYVTYHPGAMARQRPSWANDLFLNGVFDPRLDNIHELLREIYTGLQSRMPRLVALGVRGLIESVMVHQLEDRGSFRSNLQALFDAGHLSARDKDRMLKIIDVGSAVTHRAHTPTEAEVIAMVTVAENLVMSVYITDGLANTAHKRVPPRPARDRRPKQ
ncbi:hypothetical protein DBA29_26445 [Xenophilus aerolatus]|nr:hypothetical protein [Xenophilus aerolatus]